APVATALRGTRTLNPEEPPKADAMLKEEIFLLETGCVASAQLQGFPFDISYVRRAQRIAGDGYRVTLTTSDLMPNEPAILVVPRN
ncbi:hypothetical protein, partial [uncultured Pseudonocardia sp.]